MRRSLTGSSLYSHVMKSPFPGMDPYLEQHWEDVHTRLISYVADALQPQLSDDLIARMEEKAYVEEGSEKEIHRPDVRVVEHPRAWTTGAGASEIGQSSTSLLDEPVQLEPIGDPVCERSVLIYDSAGKRIVTAIEILSPSNKKPGKPLEKYLRKREKSLSRQVNLVEIDLVRTGDWTEMIGEIPVPRHLRTTYRVTIEQPELSGPLLYAIPMEAKLPTIKVPLRLQDAPANLNLQELLEKAYQMGRYDRIDYSQPCFPPPTGEEKAWVGRAIDGPRE
jgi:hypothetical protein